MKYIFIFIVTMTYMGTSYSSLRSELKSTEDKNQIEWSVDRKLTWDDFRGTPPTPDKTNAAASTNCGFDVTAESDSEGTLIRAEVKNIFYCEDSWVREDHKDKSTLLIHEQAHFDLCEVYTRRLRKMISDTNLKLDINKAINTVFNDFKSRQKLYDMETNHSINKINQVKWLKIISDELAALENFSR